MNYKAFIKYALLAFIVISIAFLVFNDDGKSHQESAAIKSKDVKSKDIDSGRSGAEDKINLNNGKIRTENKREVVNEAQSSIEAKTVTENSNEYKNTILAYYFHGNYRCHTCRTIEALAYKTINDKFAVELQAGEIIWKEINVEQTANRHFIGEFQLYSSSLVIVKKDGEKTVSWKILQDVWRLVRDENKFSEYVTNEIKDMKDRKI
jgi:hypothetical protein